MSSKRCPRRGKTFLVTGNQAPSPHPGCGDQGFVPRDDDDNTPGRNGETQEKKVCRPEDLEELGIPVLGCIPKFR